MADNRRSSTRHDVDLACAFSVNAAPSDAIETRISNLSIGGAMVKHPRLPMGQRSHVSFRVPNHETAISIGAVVRWSTDDSVGIQFDGLRPKDVWALSKYLESLQR
jgi:hypothetical protein